MALNQAELQSLLQLIEPKLQTVQQRETILQLLTSNGINLEAISQTDDKFATILLHELADTTKLAQLLKFLNKLYANDVNFVTQSRIYIDQLEPNSITPQPQLVTTSSRTSSGKRHRSNPLKRRFRHF